MARLARLWKPILTISLVFLVFACSGGGCSGCEGCGLRPIPGAFPIDARIPNSAQIRLTSSGIGFIESNIDAIVANFLAGGLDFEIPSSRVDIPTADYGEICPGGGCFAHAEIEDLQLIPTGPNVLHAIIQLRLDSRNGAGERAALPVHVEDIAGFIDADLNVDIDTTRADRTFVALETDITFAEETAPSRAGYTRIDVGTVAFIEGQGIEDDDIDISGDGIGGAIVSFLVNLFKGTVVDLLVDQISGLTDGLVGDNLCTTRTEFGCPTGTFDRGDTSPEAICYLNATAPGGDAPDACVPILLGMDGRGDLGEAFLGGFSPGTHAPIQFVLASGGEGEAIAEGMSLFMVGGFQSWNRDFTVTPGHNACVPMITPPPMPTIARASAFRGNTIPGTATETHVGIGLSEDYLDYAGYGMFDAGALCIGTGTPLAQELSTSLISLLIGSLDALAFPAENAPLAIALRPQLAPDFEIGTASGSDLLTITLPELQMDFYVWSTERYVRFMTFQTDMVIGINLAVEGNQLVPTISGITPTNSVVTNSELLTETPAMVASTLETILMNFAGMFASALSPFDLPEIMGFNLLVPEGGIRGVDSDGETFLGIFANLELAGPSPLVAPVETTLSIADVTLDPASMALETWNAGEGNSAWLYFGSEAPAGAEVEYSYRIDGTYWRPWTTDRRVRIDETTLLLQARHTIEARARVVGEFASVDATPARAELLIDILPPTIELNQDERGWIVTARDVITDADDLETRYRLPGGEWSVWTPGEVVIDAALAEGLRGDMTIETRDEAGNVAASVQPLIRGRPDPDLAAGCGCRVTSPAQGFGSGSGLLAMLVGLGLVARRARRSRRASEERARPAPTFRTPMKRFLALLSGGLLLGAISGGCDCAGSTMDACDDECMPATTPSSSGSMCCEETAECVDYSLDALCDPGFTCPPANVDFEDCEVSCSMCERRPPLSQGILATDLDYVASSEGSFVSGYSPGNPPTARYGDLVFGEVGAGGDIAWEIVDGAPSTPIRFDPDGWRGGVTDPGPDVGRWTSMVDSGTAIYIAYYDADDGDLEIAIGGAGAWDLHTIDETGNAGSYASLVLTASGEPAVSYMRVETQADGTVRSGVFVAVASSAMPGAGSDWTITEVSGAVTPCRAVDCGEQLCTETGTCADEGTCTGECADDQGCVAGTCVTIYPEGWVEDLAPRHGMYTQMVATASGLALIWYDRNGGNIWGAEAAGTTFGAPFLIDGYARVVPTGELGSGDSGIGASLFVDGTGTWHVTYVDGTEEELRYAQVTSGAVALRERIDDGSTDGTTPHDDGRHIIGDDSSVVVTSGGEVRVAYQDATDATTMLARRTGAGTWSISIVDDVDASGFWVEQVLSDTGSEVASLWRRNETGNPNGIRITAIP